MTTLTQGQGLDIATVIAGIEATTAPHLLDPDAAPAVAERAQKIACSFLEDKGNVLSADHRRAIGQLTREFADLASGKLRGRHAYALPTGMGKTTAAAAFIAALHQLDHHHVAVAVAASRVEALGDFHEKLLHFGVPDSLIGIKHTVRDSGVLNTGNESRLYQLVTHVRARSAANPFGAPTLAGSHQGRDRALCIYDETLWRADTASMRVDAVRGALGFLQGYIPSHPLASYLGEAQQRLEARFTMAEHRPQGAELELPTITETDRQDWIKTIERDSELSGNAFLAEDLVNLLQLADEPLRVISTGQGKGLISVRSAIPAGLRNVAILDASTPIRELVRLDETVHAVQLPPQLKSFENVKIFQRLTAGGRSSLQGKYRSAELAREVADIVEPALTAEPTRCVLVFTFNDRPNDKPAERIQRELRDRGIDPDALALGARDASGERRRRVEFLTWGQQEGLNGYEHCETVILAGVLTRDHISIAAAIKGQSGNPRQDTSEREIQRMIGSEVAHCVYQAASRGSCRVVQDGKAQAMRLHILYKDANLRGILEPVMPGASWEYPEPKHLPPSKRTGKTSAMLQRLLNALESYPAERLTISSQELKGSMDLDPKNRAEKDQFTRAVGQLNGLLDGWEKAGRGVRRAKRGK